VNELAETADRAGIDFSRPVNLQLRIRNNILLQAIRQRAPSVSAFCRATGYPQQYAQDYIGFKKSPLYERTNEWRADAVRLAALLDLTPEEAFPPEVCAKVKRNTAEIFCAASVPPTPQLSPRDEAARAEIAEKVALVLGTLTDRERYVVEHRFGLAGKIDTLEEIGGVFGCTRANVRLIEARALRKLRHPKRLRVLRGAMDTVNDLEVMA
jgi:RNA polymerase sigma factor (sigma-70 family)